MSRKNTLAADSANAMPVVNTINSPTRGSDATNHGSAIWPKMISATTSTPSSISSVITWATITENTRCSCGNATFLMRLELPSTTPIDVVTDIEKNWNGSSPDRKYSGNVSRPLGTPTGVGASNTIRKTKL